ncbi:MAG: sulfurtransferase [Gammaproteobacteria bacterium]|nr:MAG: sulfurtransferase [Gammaproteobacteria bacterium]
MGRRLTQLFLGCLLFAAGSVGAEPATVNGDWLETRLKEATVRIVDMSVEDLQYRRFHIPGAVRLPYNAIVRDTPKGVSLRVDPNRMVEILGVLGITADSHVVVYDDMGGLNAARLFWELERIGHVRVSVLDGGLVRWILDGRPVETEPTHITPTKYQPGRTLGRDNLADLKAVRDRGADGPLLLDVRTQGEYVGEPRVPRSGHIPGAYWWPWDQAVQFGNGFINQDADKLSASLAQFGIDSKEKPVILYCASGHRAARAYLSLRRLGFGKIKVYDGSMLEYAQVQDAPLRRGMEP